MITIGLRASPTEVTFAIYDAAERRVVNVEELVVPLAFEWPVRLRHIRSNLLDILREYGVAAGGIRMAESMAKSPSIERTYIEGVIQEAFASSGLKHFYVGQIASISRRVGIQRADFKPIVGGQNALGVDGCTRRTRVRSAPARTRATTRSETPGHPQPSRPPRQTCLRAGTARWRSCAACPRHAEP